MDRLLFAISFIVVISQPVVAGWSADGTNTYLNPTTSSARIGATMPNWWDFGRLFINLPPAVNGKPYAGIWVQSQSSQYGIYSCISASGAQNSGTAIGCDASGQTSFSKALNANAGYSNTNTAIWAYHDIFGGKAIYVQKGDVIFNDGKTQISNAQTNEDPVFSASYSGTTAYDKIAVQGVSTPQAYYGYGGSFSGGYVGVQGSATVSGTGSRYGGWFNASGGTSNYGVYSTAYGSGYAGFFAGDVTVTGTFNNPSDGKFKKNVTDLETMLDKVKKIRPVSYEFDSDKYPDMHFSKGRKNGLIAQEFANVFPDLVTDEVAPQEDKTKEPNRFKSVNYIEIIPILIKAIQEQQTTIEELTIKVKELQR